MFFLLFIYLMAGCIMTWVIRGGAREMLDGKRSPIHSCGVCLESLRISGELAFKEAGALSFI